MESRIPEDTTRKEILAITGSRAEYGLLKPILAAISQSEQLKFSLLVTGMHTQVAFGHTVDEIRADHMPIVQEVNVAEGMSMLDALSLEIKGIAEYCERKRPDAILILGDRDEAFAGAIVGSHLRIPVAHIHGGDVSGEIDDAMRHAITKLAHMHFAATQMSASRILRMGEAQWRVKVVGAPGVARLHNMQFLDRASLAMQLGLDTARQWMIVILHPSQEGALTVGQQVRVVFDELAKYPDIEKVCVYPNSDVGNEVIIDTLLEHENDAHFHIYKSISTDIFPSVLKESVCIVGNSSAGIIESGYFNVPAINIGERQRGRERGENVIESSFDTQEITLALKKVLSAPFAESIKDTHSPYNIPGTVEIIVRELEGFLSGGHDLVHKEILYPEL